MKNTRRTLVFAVSALFAVVAGGVLLCQQPQAKSISPAEAWKLMQTDSSVVVIDVRTKDEYYSDTGHLKGALLIPVQGLESRLEPLTLFKSRKLLVYCRTQGRSSRAVDTLAAKGFHAVYIDGGITEWNKEGLPVVKEPQQ
jgi:phage shock protein E